MKHLCTMPAFGMTGVRTGTRYIHRLDELKAYEADLAARGLFGTPKWTDAGRAALKEAQRGYDWGDDCHAEAELNSDMIRPPAADGGVS